MKNKTNITGTDLNYNRHIIETTDLNYNRHIIETTDLNYNRHIIETKAKSIPLTHILCYVFVLCFFVYCVLCCQFLF